MQNFYTVKLDLDVQYDVIKESGSWYSYDAQCLAQGHDALKAVLNNVNIMAELREKVSRR